MKLDRLVVGMFLGTAGVSSGCSQPAIVRAELEARDGFDFEAHELVTGRAERPSVLTGFLLGGPIAELAVVQVGARRERVLRVYAFEGETWVLNLEATLRPGVLFVDVANVAGRDRLITYEPGRLNEFDPVSGAETELVAVSSSFDPPRRNEIPHVDVTRDVNGDGRDDLVVPDVDGFQVLIQTEGGAFADAVTVGSSTDLSRILGADGYRYDPWSQSRVHEVDYDRDGRGDLVFWSGEHFEVHTQDERGLFGAAAESFTTDVALDGDGLSAFGNGVVQGRVLHSLTDMNADGIADLVVYSLQGARISRKHSSFEVHFGASTSAGGTVFAPVAGAVFQSDDKVQLGMERRDFDGDGQLDVMVTTIETQFLVRSLWKKVKGAMGDDVWLDLEFYRSRNGVYSDEPDATRRIALDGPPSHTEPGWVPLEVVLRGRTHESRKTQKGYPNSFNMIGLVGDVTGDGRSDLFIEVTHQDLTLFVGVPGPGVFARRSQSVRVNVPDDEEYVWMVDLDKDGKQDILMHHPFTLKDAHGGRKQRPGTEPYRVTTLFAR
jgi:hypothetical protein